MNRIALIAPLAGLLIGAASLLAPAPAYAYDGNDLVSFGSSATVKEGQEVHGDFVVMGGDGKVYGHVYGDAVVMGGDLYIAPSGQVDGSTVAFGGSVDNESSQAGGAHRHSGGTAMPPIPFVSPVPSQPDQSDENVDHGPPTAWYSLLVVLGILSLLAFAITPGSVRMVRDELVRRPLVGTVVGFCWPFILAAVMIALAITVIGIVLMPAVVVAVAVAYLVGRAAVAQLLGRRLFEVANVVEPSPLATAALGLVIITVVEATLGTSALWMGIVAESCVSAVALGAAMLPIMRSRQLVTAPAGPTYMPPPTPVFTPPTPPPPPGPPAVPQ